MNPSLGLPEGRFLVSCLALLSVLIVLYAHRWHKREQLIRRKLRIWILEQLAHSDLDHGVLERRLPHPRCQLCRRCLGLELEWLWERNYVASDEHGHAYRLDKLGHFRLKASRPNPKFSQKRRIRFTGHVHPR
jgi:hypothetical protein